MRFLAEDIFSVGLLFFLVGVVVVGLGKGKLGSFAEKTSAPEEAKPAGACLFHANAPSAALWWKTCSTDAAAHGKQKAFFQSSRWHCVVPKLITVIICTCCTHYKVLKQKKSCINWAFMISGEDTFWHFWSLYCLKVEWLHWGQSLAGPMFI